MPGGATGTVDASVTRDIFIPGPTRPGLSRNFTNGQTHILQTDTWHDQMVILYYKIHSFRITDVLGCNDMLPTSQSELAALPSTIS